MFDLKKRTIKFPHDPLTFIIDVALFCGDSGTRERAGYIFSRQEKETGKIVTTNVAVSLAGKPQFQAEMVHQCSLTYHEKPKLLSTKVIQYISGFWEELVINQHWGI